MGAFHEVQHCFLLVRNMYILLLVCLIWCLMPITFVLVYLTRETEFHHENVPTEIEEAIAAASLEN